MSDVSSMPNGLPVFSLMSANAKGDWVNSVAAQF